MSVYEYSARRDRISQTLGYHSLLIGVLVGVFVALITGAVWTVHNLDEQATPVATTVTSVQAHRHVSMCGKAPCTITEYETGVRMPDGQVTTVALDTSTSVGDHWTVYKSTNGDYAGYSPSNIRSIAVIFVASLLAGLLVGAATCVTLMWRCD